MKGIGERIKATRLDRGFSQMDMARMTTLSPQAIGSIERGAVKDPHIGALVQIADALGVSVAFLMGEEVAVPGKAEAPTTPSKSGHDARETAREVARVFGYPAAGEDVVFWEPPPGGEYKRVTVAELVEDRIREGEMSRSDAIAMVGKELDELRAAAQRAAQREGTGLPG